MLAAAAVAPVVGADGALTPAGEALLTWSTTAAAAFPSAPDAIPAANLKKKKILNKFNKIKQDFKIFFSSGFF